MARWTDTPMVLGPVFYFGWPCGVMRLWKISIGVSLDAPPCPLLIMLLVTSQSCYRRDAGRLIFFFLFSLLQTKLHESPLCICVFISVPDLLIVWYGPYLCDISFDLFSFCPSIEIDYIFQFYFGTYSFNFGIDFKSLNIFERLGFFSIISFD